jgi:chromosome partitioning protein
MTAQTPVVIAIVNNKGGVGKTTVAVNLGAALAAGDRRVLLMDLDSQASASLWCGVQRGHLRPSTASVLLNDFPIAQAVRPTSTPNLDLITGSIELANTDLVLCEVKGRELTLKHTLRPVGSRYDLVILDCPPNLSLIGINALMAADALIIPVAPQFLAVEGLTSLMASLERVRTRLAMKTRILGVLLTMVDQTAKGATEIRDRVRAQYRDEIFHTEINISRSLADAPASARTVLEFAPRSRAADCFRRLAGEVLDRLQA